MIGICRALKILQVARNTSCGREVVIIVDVTVGAQSRRHHMHASQREADRRMVELGIQPCICPVALLAGNREFPGNVIRIARTPVVRGVARIALRGHSLELTIGRVFVAGIAIDSGVRPGQRKTIVVLLHLLNRDRPPPHCVALLAIGAELPLVNIGVAILAKVADVCEQQLDMALHAGHRLMHPAQRIPRLIVVELGNGADRPPGICCVAVLAGDVQIAMRTVRACCRLRNRLLRKSKRQ